MSKIKLSRRERADRKREEIQKIINAEADRLVKLEALAGFDKNEEIAVRQLSQKLRSFVELKKKDSEEPHLWSQVLNQMNKEAGEELKRRKEF